MGRGGRWHKTKSLTRSALNRIRRSRCVFLFPNNYEKLIVDRLTDIFLGIKGARFFSKCLINEYGNQCNTKACLFNLLRFTTNTLLWMFYMFLHDACIMCILASFKFPQMYKQSQSNNNCGRNADFQESLTSRTGFLNNCHVSFLWCETYIWLL